MPYIPPELKEYKNWVTWRLEERDGKLTKPPYVPMAETNGQARLQKAQSNNPKTWRTYEFAKKHKLEGLGLVLTDTPYVLIDLDKCRDPQTGEIEPWAQRIINLLKSFTEISPSGTGVHIILRGEIPDDIAMGRRRKGRFEIYEEGRYMTVTGDHLKGTPRHIADVGDDLYEVLAEVFADEIEAVEAAKGLDQPSAPAAKLDDTDDEILKRILASTKGEAFSRLWEGDISSHGNDRSAADQALINTLYWWTGGDEARTDALFRQSGLMRPKWDQQRGDSTYGELTIRAAATSATSVYSPTTNGGTERLIPGRSDDLEIREGESSSLNLLRLADVPVEELSFLWAPYILLRKITFIAGDPGGKKTFLAIHLAAAVTRGRHPVTWEKVADPAPVLYLTLEDGLGDTIVPRAIAARADLNLLYSADGLNITNEDGITRRGRISLEHLKEIEDVLKKLRPKLIVFDPLQSFLGAQVDMHRANEVRPVLEGVGDLGMKYDCAVVFIAHLNKGTTGTTALYRMLGSIDLVGIARSILMVKKDNRGTSVLVHEKANNVAQGVSLEYSVDEDMRLAWGAERPDVTTMTESGGDGEDPYTKLEQAEEYVMDYLSNGPVASAKLKTGAGEIGISGTALKRALNELRKKQKIDHKRVGYGGKGSFWWYRLDLDTPDWEAIYGGSLNWKKRKDLE